MARCNDVKHWEQLLSLPRVSLHSVSRLSAADSLLNSHIATAVDDTSPAFPGPLLTSVMSGECRLTQTDFWNSLQNVPNSNKSIKKRILLMRCVTWHIDAIKYLLYVFWNTFNTESENIRQEYNAKDSKKNSENMCIQTIQSGNRLLNIDVHTKSRCPWRFHKNVEN